MKVFQMQTLHCKNINLKSETSINIIFQIIWLIDLVERTFKNKENEIVYDDKKKCLQLELNRDCSHDTN